MSFIASIGYKRPSAPEAHQWKSCGKVFYNATNHSCSLLMHGFHQGLMVAKAYDNLGFPAPMLQGDILVQTGEYQKGDGTKKSYQWCGFITSQQDEHGSTMYNILFEVIPVTGIIKAVLQAQAEDGKERNGMWLNVQLEDAEFYQPEGIKAEDENQDQGSQVWLSPGPVTPEDINKQLQIDAEDDTPWHE